MSEPASNPMSPQLERIAREKAKKGWLLLADAVTAEEEEETFYKVILSALALQVEKEKKDDGFLDGPEPQGESLNVRPNIRTKREHILPSAGYWFDGSRKAQDKGQNAEAVMFMENAYNHVENALVAGRELLVEARGYIDRLGQEGVRERIDAFLKQTEPLPQSTASIHESARRNPKSDFNEGGMT